MIGYDTFNIHQSFKMKDKMDIIKYNFKTNAKESSFQKSKLKYQFIKFEQEYDRNFILGYFWYISTYYKGMLFKFPISKKIVDEYKNYRNNLVKSILSEIDKFSLTELTSKGSLWPKCIELYKASKISLEVICFIELYHQKVVQNFEADEYDFSYQSIKKQIAFDKTFVGLICNDALNK